MSYSILIGELFLRFKFSVVMAAYNSEKYIAEAIDSLINQSIGFKDNIQLVIVNDSSSDDTVNIALKYQEMYPENIVIISNDENHGAAYTRNIGLKYIEGEIVNFLDSDDKISSNTFKIVYDFLNKHNEVNIASIPIYFFGSKKGSHLLNYKFYKTQIINLFERPDFIQLSAASSFFRANCIENHEFNENLRVSEDPFFINQLLLKNPKIAYIDEGRYYYRKETSQNSLLTSAAGEKSYYQSRIGEFYLGLIKSSFKYYDNVPEFIQQVMIYDLNWLFNIKDINIFLEPDEIKDLYRKLIEILSYIDDNVIVNQRFMKDFLKVHVLLLKNFGTDYLDKNYDLNNDILDYLNLDKVFLDIIEFKSRDEIYILGQYKTFDKKENEIFAVLDGKQEIKTTKVDSQVIESYSLSYNYGYTIGFEITLPVCEKISFKSNLKELEIDYNPTSRLTRTGKYMLSRHYLVVDNLNYISIIDRKFKNTVILETKTLKSYWDNKEQGWRTGIILRILFFILYPFYKNRHIWIHMDLPNRAEDNGVEFFKHVPKNEGITHYFAIEKSSDENSKAMRKNKFKRLLSLNPPNENYLEIKKYGNVLDYGSMKHRLYTLFAERIISSQPDNYILYPFWDNFTHLAGLLKSKNVFLQHGVTKDNISYWLNKYNKNLKLIVTVSDKEKKSFHDSSYVYEKDVIQVLGFPRFDSLEKLEDKKEIILMPTWRQIFADLNKNQFKNTTFFKEFNKILNDSDLINFIDSKGYKLVFKPHPNLIRFMDTFDKHSNVGFDFNTRSYKDIFNHSSVLITDFSSVFFDFAYLKKPIIYYHYDNANYHFDLKKSYFKYDTMGFGPVTTNFHELKQTLIKTIETECELKEEYKLRIDNFFEFIDRNNSNRVLIAIQKIDDYY